MTPNFDDQPVKPKFWAFNAGQLVTLIVFVASLIYGASAFATKSDADIDAAKIVAVQLQEHEQKIDDRDAALEARMAAVETGISYIRQSVDRIERNVIKDNAGNR